jgi:hypothetical protein
MFALCVQPDIAVLKARYVIECSDCDDRVVEVFESSIDVPQEIYCGECGRTFKVTSDNIVIWLVEPIIPGYLISEQKVDDSLGKQIGLRNTVAANSPIDVIRRLSVSYTERGMGI